MTIGSSSPMNFRLFLGSYCASCRGSSSLHAVVSSRNVDAYNRNLPQDSFSRKTVGHVSVGAPFAATSPFAR